MDVRLPNGEVVRNVPEGTSKADLVAKLRAGGHDMSWVDGPSTPAPVAPAEETAGIGANLKRVFGLATPEERAQAEHEYDTEQGIPGAVKNVGQLTKRSVARLGEGLTELPGAAVQVASDPAGTVGGALSTVAAVAGAPKQEVEAADKAFQTPLSNASSETADTLFAPVVESAPIKNARAWTQQKEQEAVAALTPKARRALELSLVEHDEDTGELKIGAGAKDPWWWTANVIDVGVQAAPGMGVTAVSARLSYAAKYRQVLEELAAQKIPQSIAIKVAEKQAMAAATRSAVIAGGLTEGAVGGGGDASETRATIESLDEETLMNYPGYIELRDKGLSHEQARDKIASDKAAAVAVSAGAAIGLTGAPMNAFFGRLTAKLGRTEAVTLAQRARAGATAALGEAAQEGVQEGTEQLIQNKNEGPLTGAGTWDNVLENSITGFTLGGVVGGGAGLLLHKGAKAKPGEGPITDTPDSAAPSALQSTETAYEAASQKLRDGLVAARDPNVKMKYGDLEALREEHRKAMVDFTRELLHTGNIPEEQQGAVTEALKQAGAEGITPKTGTPAGGDVSPARDKALEAAANAEMMDESDANDLISNKLAKVNPRGVIVLTPEGRRERKAAQERAAAADKKGIEKPLQKPVVTKPVKVAPTKPVVTLPAEKRAQRAASKALPAKEPVAEKAAPKTEAVAETAMGDAFKAAADRARRARTGLSSGKEIAFRVKEQPQLPQQTPDERRLDIADEATMATVARRYATPAEVAKALAGATTEERAKRLQPLVDRGWADPANVAFRLKGAPESVNIPGKGNVKVEPVKVAKDAAAAYRAAKGITTPEQTEFARVDPKRAKRIAQAFEEMKHEPNNPTVKRAYHAMINETKAQWDQIKKTGLKVEFIKPDQKDPYAKSPRMAIEDVRDNNHLWVYPTDSGFGSDNKFAKDNPMLEDAGETVGGHKLKNNDVFRIVHDYFGHVQEANGFRADGEENAWRIHAGMYSPLARRAMTTETRGQNSWVNYGPKGEANRTAKAGETAYADQKIGLLPAEFSSFPGDTLKFKHFSNATDDQLDLDPEKMGTGAKGAEAKRNGPKVISLYAEHGETEPDVSNGRTRYNVEIPKEDLYDGSADPQRFLAQSQVPYGMTTDAQGNTVPVGHRFDMNKFEELVRDAGYLGYHLPEAQGILKGQARIFQKYPATKHGLEQAREIAARMKRASSEEKVRGLLTPEENARLKKASAKKLIEVFDELPAGAELAASALAGQAKRGWYRHSAQAIANVFGPDAPRFAALLAALSPQTSVEWNFRNAVATWVGWDKAGRPTDRKAIVEVMRDNMFPNSNRVGKANILPAWINNTVRALTAEDASAVVLSGPKVDSFAANLRGETERVTLDAWMANWAGVSQTLFAGTMNVAGDSPGMRPGYLAYAARVREAAQILSDRTGETWTPAEVQETVWSWAKTLFEQAESFGALATARELVENKELNDELINATPDFAGQFADPEVSSLLAGTVYGPRAAASAAEAATRSGPAGKATPSAEDDRHLRKAADRLDALRKSRQDAESQTREDNALRTTDKTTTGIPMARLQAVAARVKAELGVDAHIADTQADLPDFIQEMLPDDGGKVTGMFVQDNLAGTNEIYYVRENLDDEAEAYENALHESVGHMGLRAVLGKNYHRVMEDIRTSFPEKTAWAAKQNGIDMNHSDPATRRRLQSLAAEELVAYAAGRVLAKRGALSQQNVWRKIVAKVREILRGVGLLNSYSGEDIEALIYRARDFFTRKPGKTRAQEIEYQGDMAKAMKQQTADAPQWLSPDEYLQSDGSTFTGATDFVVDQELRIENPGPQSVPIREQAALDETPVKGPVNPTLVFDEGFDEALKEENADFAFTELSAYAGDRKIGYVALSKDLVGDKGWSPEYVYVRPAYRGKGIAQRMYAAISKRLGVPAKPSIAQTGLGKRMWDSFKRRDVAFAFKQGPTGNADLDSFISKIGVRPKTLAQRWNEFRHDLKEKAIMGLFDELHGIQAAEEIAGVDEKDQGYVSARLSRAAPEVVASIIEHGPPVWNDGAPDVGQGMGLLSILAPLKGNVNLWLTYVSALRAERLKSEGRENLFTANEIAAAKALGTQHPEFNVARARYNTLQKQVLDFAQEAGVIDPQTRAMWEHSDYIPFHRIMQGGEVTISNKAGKGIGFIRNQIKQLKGGRQNIGDPLENIVRNWQALMDASLQAVAGRMTIDNLNGTGLVTPHKFVANAAPILSLGALTKANPNLAAALNNAGINIATMPPQALAGLQKMLNIAPPAGEDVVTVWRNGKREFWHVHDPNLFRSLKNINPKLWGPWMKLFSYPKHLVTKTVTMTPQFMIKNFWRDMWHSFVTGAQSDKTRINMLPTDSLAGLASALANSPDYRSMVAGGGGFGESFVESGDPTSMAGAVRRSITKSKSRGIVLNTPVKVWRFYRMLQNAAENANRVAVFKKSMKAGLDRRAALYQARDLMDFSMRGNAEIIRLIVGMTPFFNARLQGLYRLGRGGRQSFVSVALRGLILSAASLALLAANHDDDRYKALTDQEKSTYWHFFVGDGHYKVPKPFEVGTIFGTIPEAIGDAMITNSDQPDAMLQSAKLVGYSFGETLNLAPQPATVWPLVELAINQDTFTGAPILTQGDESILPEDQRGPQTSSTYAQLARVMPADAPEALRSPKQLEHLGRGYIGNIQDYVLAVSDSLVRKANGEPAAPEKALQDIPGLRDFYRTGPARNTRHIIEMYKLADEAAKVNGSINKAEKAENDEGDARIEELEKKYPQLLDVAEDFKKAAQDVTDLKKEQRQIQLDATMTPAEKRAQMDDIQKEINDIAKDVYDLRPGGKLNPEVAGELLTAPPTARAKILRQNNMPATADLLEQFA